MSWNSMMPVIGAACTLMSLEELIQSLHVKTKVRFILRGGGDKKVTAELRNTTPRGAIEALCAASGMDYAIQQMPRS